MQHGMEGAPTAYWKNEEAMHKASQEQWQAGSEANAAAAEAAAAGHIKGSQDVSAMESKAEKEMIASTIGRSDAQIGWAKKLKKDSKEKYDQADKAYKKAE